MSLLRMILITTALMVEARPLAARLDLQAGDSGTYKVFEGPVCRLVVTGVGALRSSAATGWAMARFPGIQTALNIGFCGASPSASELYRWHFISSIRDQTTGRLSLPDILWTHPFPEAALLTVPKVMDSDRGWTGLVDMEGSGFYEAARQFLPPDRIALLKWVSDPVTGTIDVEKTRIAFEQSLEPVVHFIREWTACADRSAVPDRDELSPRILACLRLTRTQTAFLRKWIPGYLARGGDPHRLLEILPESPPAYKNQNALLFESLKHVLKG